MSASTRASHTEVIYNGITFSLEDLPEGGRYSVLDNGSQLLVGVGRDEVIRTLTGSRTRATVSDFVGDLEL